MAMAYFETKRYIFTHGFLPVLQSMGKPQYYPEWRRASSADFTESRWLNGMELACKYRITEPGKTIVCGHYHTSYGHSVLEGKGSELGADADHSPFYADGIIALDACTAVSGSVNCIVLEDGCLPCVSSCCNEDRAK